MLHTALAFGKPLVLSRLGGFIDVAEQHGAARLVEPEDPVALAEGIDALLSDPEERARLAAAAAGPAARSTRGALSGSGRWSSATDGLTTTVPPAMASRWSARRSP